jgi:tripeptidyl-peptidase I
VNEFAKPSQHTLSLVDDWLREHGIVPTDPASYSPSRDWITLNVTVATAESLLRAEYSEYWHAETDSLAVRTPSWSLPAHLHAHIESIQPTTSFLHASLLPPIDFPRNTDTDTDTNLNQAANEFEFAPGTNLPGIDLTNPSPNLTVAQACNASAVTPLCIRVLYGTIAYVPRAADRNTMALVNYSGEFNNRSDIDVFLSLYRPDIAATLPSSNSDSIKITNDEIAGGINFQSPITPAQRAKKSGREGGLDAQILLGIAFPTKLRTYTVGGSPPPPFVPDLSTPTNTNEPFLEWLRYVLSRPDGELPSVVATSYGDTEATVPPAYARRVCEGFAQLGARGVTVVFGAGDWGVGKGVACDASSSSSSSSEDEEEEQGGQGGEEGKDGKKKKKKFHGFLSSFPASCPYGTSVGATRDVNPERVAYNDNNGFVSGGGFSRIFARPGYQSRSFSSRSPHKPNPRSQSTTTDENNDKKQTQNVIDAYLSTLLGSKQNPEKYKGLFNPNGRAYPDVASQGYRRPIVWDGKTYLVDGTSASAPTFAAVVALVNDALIADGQPPMGFLNPWLYSVGGVSDEGAFTDVVHGDTKGCGTVGFRAGVGWDSASGFGTPVSFFLLLFLLLSFFPLFLSFSFLFFSFSFLFFSRFFL